MSIELELVDTHCHIQSAGAALGEKMTRELWAKAGDTNVSDILKRAHEAGVTRIVCVGCDMEDSALAVQFASVQANCWAAVGIHPHETSRIADVTNTATSLERLARDPKVVAIGECGLDYFYSHSSKEDQLAALKMHMELAMTVGKPLIFHVREAFDDFWPIFESYTSAGRPLRGVLHSFTDTTANLDRALKHGLFIGVNGIATFTKNADQQAMYRHIPSERLLLETDAPFLTPVPYRGKICEPYHIRTIAEYLAAQRGQSLAQLAAITTENARTLFGI